MNLRVGWSYRLLLFSHLGHLSICHSVENFDTTILYSLYLFPSFLEKSCDVFYLLIMSWEYIIHHEFSILSCSKSSEYLIFLVWKWIIIIGELDGRIWSLIKMVVWAHQTLKMRLIHGLPGLTSLVPFLCYLSVHAFLCKLLNHFNLYLIIILESKYLI